MPATHQHLESLVAEGRFREDLYYRLAVIPVQAPALRERREDISLLIESFIDRFSRRKGDRRTSLGPIALKSLQAYHWPGNVRELENLVQRLVILHRGKKVTIKELPEKYRCEVNESEPEEVVSAEPGTGISVEQPEVQWSEAGLDFNQLISDFEDRLILEALERAAGNKKEAARLLNLKRTTLIEKIKKKGLEI